MVPPTVCHLVIGLVVVVAYLYVPILKKFNQQNQSYLAHAHAHTQLYSVKTNHRSSSASFLGSHDYWANEVTVFLHPMSPVPRTPPPPIPPNSFIFPTFLCWCGTVTACHLAGMSRSPTSSPRCGVKHSLLVSDSARARPHETLAFKMCSRRCCPLGCIPTLGVWPQ